MTGASLGRFGADASGAGLTGAAARAGLLLWVLAAAGCAGLAQYPQPPRVTLSDIAVIEASVLEQLYRVTLRVQNPNDHPLPVRGGRFELSLDGRTFATGVSDAAVTVPPYADGLVEVRMVSTLFDMLRLVRGFEAGRGEPLRYELSGRLAIVGSYTGLGFRETGELALPAAPRAP